MDPAWHGVAPPWFLVRVACFPRVDVRLEGGKFAQDRLFAQGDLLEQGRTFRTEARSRSRPELFEMHKNRNPAPVAWVHIVKDK